MTIIYSRKRIEGLEGRYIDPALYSGPVSGATVVYTDDKDIAKAYDNAEINPINAGSANIDPLEGFTNEERAIIQAAVDSGDLVVGVKKDGHYNAATMKKISALLGGE